MLHLPFAPIREVTSKTQIPYKNPNYVLQPTQNHIRFKKPYLKGKPNQPKTKPGKTNTFYIPVKKAILIIRNTRKKISVTKSFK